MGCAVHAMAFEGQVPLLRRRLLCRTFIYLTLPEFSDTQRMQKKNEGVTMAKRTSKRTGAYGAEPVSFELAVVRSAFLMTGR
jgi:hypothetical protein